MSEKKSIITKGDIAGLISVYVLYGLAQASGEFRVFYLKEQGMSAQSCGWVLAAAALLTAIARPVSGAIADKLRRRRPLLIFGTIMWIIVMAGLILLKDVWLADFLLCAGIVPLISIADPVTYGMIEASGVEASMRAPKLDFSLIRVTLSIGYSLINFAYTPIVNKFGPRAPFVCTAVFVAVLLVVSGKLSKFENFSDNGAVKEQEPAGKKLDFKPIFANYFLVCFVVLNFVNMLGNASNGYLVYLLETIGLDTSTIGYASGIRVIGEIIIMPLVPLIKRRLSLPMIQGISGLIRIIQLVVFLTVKNPGVILALVSLNGIAGGLSLGTSAVYLRAMAPQGLATTTMALSNITSSLGSIVINLFAGGIVDSYGVFALYKVSICIISLWVVLYFGTWIFGEKVLKKKPMVPLFLRKY